jgi:hypothetical protein
VFGVFPREPRRAVGGAGAGLLCASLGGISRGGVTIGDGAVRRCGAAVDADVLSVFAAAGLDLEMPDPMEARLRTCAAALSALGRLINEPPTTLSSPRALATFT